jgi:hypothetical protein
MRLPYTFAALAALLAPTGAQAQAATVPPPAQPGYAPTYFAPGPTRAWTFSGCQESIAPFPGARTQTYCVSGLLTGGLNPVAATEPMQPGFVWYLDLNTTAQHDPFDIQRFIGTSTNPASGSTCRTEVIFDYLQAPLIPGQLAFRNAPYVNPPDPWALELSTVEIRLFTYGPPQPGGDTKYRGNGVFAVTAVSTVPEPSTYALLGTGLLTLGGIVARRRRRRV